MNNKIFGVIIILIGLLLLSGIVYVVFFDQNILDSLLNKTKEAAIRENKPAKEEKKEAASIPESKNVKKIVFSEGESGDENEPVGKKEAVSAVVNKFGKDDLKRMASSYAERFGSYSNQSNFSNIIDLKFFMSRKMQKWADSYVNEQRRINANNDIYYGITTKAISEEIKTYDDDIGQASILVKTRRREASSSTNNISNVFAQNIIIDAVKENGAWKIDGARWEDK